MTRTPKKKVMRDMETIWNELTPLLGEYLEAYGWKAAVIGEDGVFEINTSKHKFGVAFDFVGGRIDGQAASKRKGVKNNG